MSRAVSAGVRVVGRNPEHVTVVVFAGRNPGARGNSGSLVFRADEWDELAGSGLLTLAVEPERGPW